MKMIFNKDKTNRGFSIVNFDDDNLNLCDIQKSSACDSSKIWLGPHKITPIILASKTKQGGTGWVDYEVPDDVFISGRMHLTRKQSVILGLRLLKFGFFDKL